MVHTAAVASHSSYFTCPGGSTISRECRWLWSPWRSSQRHTVEKRYQPTFSSFLLWKPLSYNNVFVCCWSKSRAVLTDTNYFAHEIANKFTIAQTFCHVYFLKSIIVYYLFTLFSYNQVDTIDWLFFYPNYNSSICWATSVFLWFCGYTTHLLCVEWDVKPY